MKILSSNVALNSQHQSHIEHQAELSVSLEKNGDTYQLSQGWKLSADEASAHQAHQALSSDAQTKSLELLGKLRKLTDSPARPSSASQLNEAGAHNMLTRPAPQAQDRTSVNPAGKLNRGRGRAQLPTLTGDQDKDAKLFALSLLISKTMKQSVFLSKLKGEARPQDTSGEVLHCTQGLEECDEPADQVGSLLSFFYGIERDETSDLSISSFSAPMNEIQSQAPSTLNVLNGSRSVEVNGSVQVQRFRLDIGEAPEAEVEAGEIIEISYHEERIESECLSVTGCGNVTLEDGREIQFDIDMSLERYSVQTVDLNISNRPLKDPLIIDFGPEVARFTDQRFEFDLDADGEMDSMSALDQSGGILVMDHDQDGVVDDGTEVIGALSSDAFGDLRALDDDQNGWIDEQDEVYEQLRVWTWSEEGEQELLTLAEVDVGAIYLGAVEAQFSFMDDRDQQIAQQRSQSVYLKHSGEVGSARQVDLVM